MIFSSLLSRLPGIVHGFGTQADVQLPEGIVLSKQVHGTAVHLASKPGQMVESECDIVMTGHVGIPVAIKTADCLSVLMVEPEAGLVAAVHAGWKGTLARVSQVAIEKIRSMGGDPEKIHAAMGPSMKAHCYEVASDVEGPFRKEFPVWPQILKVLDDTGRKWLLDVPETNRQQMMASGVLSENIDHIDLCTYCRPELFYSYRREGETAGRMISFIQLTSDAK